MIKLMILLKRKAGMSREAFIDYYENVHAPLVLAATPEIVEYRRSYVMPETLLMLRAEEGAPAPELPFDVVAEAWYPDRAAYDAAIERVRGDSELSARLAADGDNFRDRASMTLFLADERIDG